MPTIQQLLLPVLSSIKEIVPHFRWVTLNWENLYTSIPKWFDVPEANQPWSHPCHFADGTAETVRWVFMLDLLNHCFWPDEGETTWAVTYDGIQYSGYWALAASLKRAWEGGVRITPPEAFKNISKESLERVFAGQGRIPLFEERLANLQEAGEILLKDWDGDVVHVVEAARGDAVALVHLVVQSFPSFRDEAKTPQGPVYFWKRAQIFAFDLYQAFDGRGWGHLARIDELTAFADYKLPQVLRALGIISYHPDLAEKIDDKKLLQPQSEEEVEIRAATIWAVELLRQVLEKVGRNATSTHIDNWLWQLGQLEPFRQKPYHRCRTIYY